MILSVAAQTNTSESPFGSWQPPKDFVDPVTLKIQEFKAQGLNDDQITAELEELGMGWYPETGATWMGRTVTPEEFADIPTISPVKASSDKNTISFTKITSAWRTSNPDWTGVGSNVVSGSMSVQSGETTLQYLCVQLGRPITTNWVEIVLKHTVGGGYEWFCLDNDEGIAGFGEKDTPIPITAADNYVIMLDGTQDGNGWCYDAWINYDWVRSGHLTYLFCYAGFQKEVTSSTGIFTDDASRSVFCPNWLHDASGWSYWRTFDQWWGAAYPLREYHYIFASTCWAWQTWVQN